MKLVCALLTNLFQFTVIHSWCWVLLTRKINIKGPFGWTWLVAWIDFLPPSTSGIDIFFVQYYNWSIYLFLKTANLFVGQMSEPDVTVGSCNCFQMHDAGLTIFSWCRLADDYIVLLQIFFITKKKISWIAQVYVFSVSRNILK